MTTSTSTSGQQTLSDLINQATSGGFSFVQPQMPSYSSMFRPPTMMDLVTSGVAPHASAKIVYGGTGSPVPSSPPPTTGGTGTPPPVVRPPVVTPPPPAPGTPGGSVGSVGGGPGTGGNGIGVPSGGGIGSGGWMWGGVPFVDAGQGGSSIGSSNSLGGWLSSLFGNSNGGSSLFGAPTSGSQGFGVPPLASSANGGSIFDSGGGATGDMGQVQGQTDPSTTNWATIAEQYGPTIAGLAGTIPGALASVGSAIAKNPYNPLTTQFSNSSPHGASLIDRFSNMGGIGGLLWGGINSLGGLFGSPGDMTNGISPGMSGGTGNVTDLNMAVPVNNFSMMDPQSAGIIMGGM